MPGRGGHRMRELSICSHGIARADSRLGAKVLTGRLLELSTCAAEGRAVKDARQPAACARSASARSACDGQGWRITRLCPVSGAGCGHFLLGVGDGALEGLDVVAFCLADDFLDGAG